MYPRKFKQPKTAFGGLLASFGVAEKQIPRTSTTSLSYTISETKNPANLQDFEDSTSRIPRPVGPGQFYYTIKFLYDV